MKINNYPRNWSENIQFSTPTIEYPRSLSQIKQIIKKNIKVHVGGTFHCFNNIADSQGIIISLKYMNKICTKCPNSVLIEAGVTYSLLAEELAKFDRAIINFPSLPHLNIIGSIVTGTHGGGKDLLIMASLVEEYTIMDGNGNLYLIKKSDPRFKKLLVSLGYLGIIVSVRLKTVPSFEIQKSIYQNIEFDQFKKVGTSIFSEKEYSSLFIDLNKKGVSSAWFGKKIKSNNFTGIFYKINNYENLLKNI